ncbi:hypothetical protein [Sinosporangium album]|uniref:hypothetical protein n=1 Tax=Sinosporangium album TaxID=504805 RepID=UPI00115F82DA|nr:hypothetical protein [Sinosporangium album]
MSSKLTISIGIVIVLLVIVAGCGSIPAVDHRNSASGVHSASAGRVSIDSLLVEDNLIPGAIKQKFAIAGRTSDKVGEVLLEMTQAEENLSRTWIDADQVPSITQIVTRFSGPSDAGEDYRSAPHGRNYHVVDGLKAHTVLQSDFSLKADSSRIFCVEYRTEFSPDDCRRWGWRACYGSFVVDIIALKFVGDNQYIRIDRREFVELVVAVDAHIAQVLH